MQFLSFFPFAYDVIQSNRFKQIKFLKIKSNSVLLVGYNEVVYPFVCKQLRLQ